MRLFQNSGIYKAYVSRLHRAKRETTRCIDVRLVVARGRKVATVAGLALGHYVLFIAMSTSLQTAMVTGGLLFVLPLVSLISPPPRRRDFTRPPLAAPQAAGSTGGLALTPLAST